jgi:phage portal protein BeeE
MALTLFKRKPAAELERGSNDPTLTLDAFLSILNEFTYQGSGYSYLTNTTWPGAKQEQVGQQLDSVASLAYKTNAVVFSCMQIRANLLSEGRFAFQQLRSGRPGNLFGAPPLARLETPWPGGTTGDLIARMIQYVDLAGNAFVVRNGPGLALLRPDWVSIVIGAPGDPLSTAWSVDSEILGYVYREGGAGSEKDPVLFAADEVCHWAPIPDPQARFRGMSWVTPLAREVMADKAMTEFKLAYMENGATPNLAVKLDVPDLDAMERWVEKFGINHDGARNAGKTMYMSSGMDATPIGANMQQVDFSKSLEAGEKRIASASGVPVILTSLNLDSATFSNYGFAMRFLADMTARPLWRSLCGALSNIITIPNGARLWIDDRDIAALRGDQTDAAEIQNKQASSMQILINSGFEPDTVIDAVTSGDYSVLEHTGLVSVQLQPPGVLAPPDTDEPTGASEDTPQLNGKTQPQLPAAA